VVSDGALSVRVNALRRALEDDGHRQAVIRTVPKCGYRFVADVSAGASPVVEVAARSTAPGAESPTKTTLIILPFRNLSGAPGRILAEGLTFDLTTRMGRTRCVAVTARGTASKFGPREQDVQAVGARLNVRYACQGSVQIEGSRVHVHAALAETATREELWAEAYDLPLNGLLRAQEHIAPRIVSALEVELERQERLHSLLIPSENLDAWSAFHRGCWHMFHFQQEHVEHADRMFHRSIELEPTVPRPYAGLSFVHFERAFLGLSHNRSNDIRQANDLAVRALELDPKDPMAHWAHSRAFLQKGDLEASSSCLHTAVDLNPSYAIALYTLGWVNMHLGRNEQTIEQIAEARRLSPLDPLMFAMMGVQGLSMALSGRTREGAELARESLDQPNIHSQVHAFAAVSLSLDHQWDAARQQLRRVRKMQPGYGARHFLENFPFQRSQDVATIRAVFRELNAPGSTPGKRVTHH
jgi:TolB-like protein/Flp pilus assembly protein TadD